MKKLNFALIILFTVLLGVSGCGPTQAETRRQVSREVQNVMINPIQLISYEAIDNCENWDWPTTRYIFQDIETGHSFYVTSTITENTWGVRSHRRRTNLIGEYWANPTFYGLEKDESRNFAYNADIASFDEIPEVASNIYNALFSVNPLPINREEYNRVFGSIGAIPFIQVRYAGESSSRSLNLRFSFRWHGEEIYDLYTIESMLQRNFVNLARQGYIDEELSEEVFIQIPPVLLTSIYINGEEMRHNIRDNLVFVFTSVNGIETYKVRLDIAQDNDDFHEAYRRLNRLDTYANEGRFRNLIHQLGGVYSSRQERGGVFVAEWEIGENRWLARLMVHGRDGEFNSINIYKNGERIALSEGHRLPTFAGRTNHGRYYTLQDLEQMLGVAFDLDLIDETINILRIND